MPSKIHVVWPWYPTRINWKINLPYGKKEIPGWYWIQSNETTWKTSPIKQLWDNWMKENAAHNYRE